MTIEYMRQYLRKCYGGAQKWVNKVNKMSDNQVIAVYYRIVQDKNNQDT